MPPKTAPKKAATHKKAPEAVAKVKYVERIGRRKTAIARVRIVLGEKKVTVNGKKLEEYFPIKRLSLSAIAPLTVLHLMDAFGMSAKVIGGGIKAQAEAVRLGLSRALVSVDPELKKRLKKLGFMTRDSRAVERKKYGLKKARRAPQWSKR